MHKQQSSVSYDKSLSGFSPVFEHACTRLDPEVLVDGDLGDPSEKKPKERLG